MKWQAYALLSFDHSMPPGAGMGASRAARRACTRLDESRSFVHGMPPGAGMGASQGARRVWIQGAGHWHGTRR